MGRKPSISSDAVLVDKYVGTAYDNVLIVATNIDAVIAVSELADEIGGLYDNIDDIVIVANNIDDVVIVANDIDNVNTVATNIVDVGVVADNIADVSIVADNIVDIVYVADNWADINQFYNLFILDPAAGPGIITIDANDKLTYHGDFEVLGDTILADVLQVEDKNIEIGKVDTPSDVTADGGGITLKGATDKTIIWTNADDAWHYNQDINIDTGFLLLNSTKSDWWDNSEMAALQLGNSFALGGINSWGYYGINFYYDAGFKGVTTGVASFIRQTAGSYEIDFGTAASPGATLTSITTPLYVDVNDAIFAVDVNITTGNSLLVDTISEKTAAAGVTIDGVLLKDGGGTFSGVFTVEKGSAGVVTAHSSSIGVFENSDSLSISLLAPDSRYTSIYFGSPASSNIDGRITYGHSTVATTADRQAMQFWTAGTERMRIDSSGNLAVDGTTFNVDAVNKCVGIGTAGPASITGVAGYLEIAGSSSGIGLKRTGGALWEIVNGADVLKFNDDGTTKLSIDSFGNVLIGSGVTPSQKLHVYTASGSVISLTESAALSDGTGAYAQSAGTASGDTRYGLFGVWKNLGVKPTGFMGLYAADGNPSYLWADDSDILRISTTITHIGTINGTVVGMFSPSGVSGDAILNGSAYEAGTYGGIHVHSNVTAQSIATGASYVKVTAFMNDNVSNNVTSDYANDKITITKTGVYRVEGSFSFSCGTNNTNVFGTIFLNGVEQDAIHFERKVSTAGDLGNAGFTGFIDVTTASWDLDFRVRHSAGSAVDITFTYANLNLVYIGET